MLDRVMLASSSRRPMIVAYEVSPKGYKVTIRNYRKYLRLDI
jgi:hypothetical protein